MPAHRPHRRVHLIHPGVVVDVQYPIYLWQVPAEAARQFRFADALLPHLLIEHYLDGRERRQHSNLTAG